MMITLLHITLDSNYTLTLNHAVLAYSKSLQMASDTQKQLYKHLKGHLLVFMPGYSLKRLMYSMLWVT